VVTWTHSTTTYTVGHGLGVAPSLIIVKDRSFAYNWDVYHVSLGNTLRLNLNTTGASSAGFWYNTSPTSSVFTYQGTALNNGDLAVAYCFAAVAGYSAFGSYTANASTDGPMVFLNFRPRYIMFKNTTRTGNWLIYDSARNTYNAVDSQLYPDLSNAEATGANLDFLSNGFKVRAGSGSGINSTSGDIYIYAAFAENPFKYALAR
jgi:hypothetical protein